MIYVKMHDTENGIILAVCDEKLINEILIDGELEINIKNYQDFYIGELINKEELLDGKIKINEIFSANIIGEEAVFYGIKNKIIQEQNIKKIKNIPYAHAYKIY